MAEHVIKGKVGKGTLSVSRPRVSGKIVACGGVLRGKLTNAAYVEEYDGVYIIEPKAYESTVLDTTKKFLLDDVTVLEIPYSEVTNPSGGKTFTIG